MDIAQENWMFPCNVKDFDIVSHLKKAILLYGKKEEESKSEIMYISILVNHIVQ